MKAMNQFRLYSNMNTLKSKIITFSIFALPFIACNSGKDLDLGKKLIQEGDYQQGISYLDKYLKRYPNSQEALFFKVSAEKELEAFSSARATYWELLPLLDSGLAHFYNDYGDILYKLGMIDSAMYFFRQAYTIDSAAENLNYNLAVAYYHDLQDTSKALRHLLKEIARDSLDEKSMSLATSIHLALNNTDSTESYIERILKINPESHDAFYVKGILLFRKQEYDSALTYYTKAIEIAPEHAEYYSKRAASFGMLGDYYRSIKDCNRAIQIDSNNLDAYIVRFGTYLTINDLNNACQDLNQIKRMDPNSKYLKMGEQLKCE